MNIKEAIEEMMQGNFVTRDKYDESAEYYAILPGMPFVWKIMNKPNPAAGSWQPFVDDLVANDWKVVSRVPQHIVEMKVQ